MEITINKENEKLALTVSGRVDTTTAPRLEAAVNENIEGMTELIFDIEKLEYISSAGLRVILVSQKRMNKQGRMVIRHANADIREIFDITGFSDIITIED